LGGAKKEHGVIAKAAKAAKVTALHAKFADAKAAIVADYSGLNVQQLAELRSQLREAVVELYVVKNTLARRAVEETSFIPLADHFVGPTSVAFAQHDAVAMAKALTEYAKKEPKLNVRVGFVEGQLLTPEQISALAELPPREVLLARMLASMQSPVTGFVGVLQGILRQLVYALQAVRDAKEKTSQEESLAGE
jgi:large subunit ribosomal protein L10